MGVSISIDDFGTGYSSLSYLKKFPINTLKVDRTFIRDILSSGDDAAIVKAIVAMAQSLRLNIVAEGVEDSAQLAFLDSIGCDQYQGYFFSRPVPSNVVPTLFDVGAQGDSLSIADAAHDARGAAPASYAPAGSTS
jgi:EAL domain-containing protein (putative c-di-GMP-specific phosphodiesterase class I)